MDETYIKVKGQWRYLYRAVDKYGATVNIRLTHVRLQRPKHFPAKAAIKEDMESTLSQVLAPSELAPVNGKGATPFAQQTVVLTKQAYIELTWQANYWRAQYEQLLERKARHGFLDIYAE